MSEQKQALIRNAEMEEFLGFHIEPGEAVDVVWSNIWSEWVVTVESPNPQEKP